MSQIKMNKHEVYDYIADHLSWFGQTDKLRYLSCYSIGNHIINIRLRHTSNEVRDSVEPLAPELRVVDEQIPLVRRVQHLAENFGLVLVVGRGGLVVQPEARDERLGDIVARQLLQGRDAEDRVQLGVVVAAESDQRPVRRKLPEKVHDRNGVGDDRQMVEFAVGQQQRELIDGRRGIEKDDVALFDDVQRLLRHHDLLRPVGDHALLIGGRIAAGRGRLVVDQAAPHAFDGIALGENRDVAMDGGRADAKRVHQLLEGAGLSSFEVG